MKKFKERRKQKRFNINDRSTVLVFPNIVLSYGVLDVSDSGLAFSYAGWERWPKEGIKMDILDQDFFLENIAAKVINDVQLSKGSKNLRRCGVEFTDLATDQRNILKRYIESVAGN